MNKILLILWLCLPIFAARTIYVPVTIQSAKIGETNAHFPYLVDLSRMPSAWWDSIRTKGNIFVKDGTGAVKHRVVDSLDFPAHKGFITIDASVSASANKVYNIYACADSAQANASNVFTVANCVIRHSLDESVSPLIDACGNYDYINSGAMLGTSGKVGKCVNISGTVTIASGSAITQMIGATKWTHSFLFNPNDFGGNWISGNITDGHYFQGFVGIFNYAIAPGVYKTLSAASAFIPFATWSLVSVVYDYSLGSDVDRLKLYVNGSNVLWNLQTGIVPSSLTTSAPWQYNNSSYPGAFYLDEEKMYSDAKSAGWETTEYNMIFDTTSVVIGSAVIPGASRGAWGFSWGFRNWWNRAFW
jgi:hypothetical protein